MVLDHIHYFFAFTGRVPVWFSMAGRLSAPLFLFCLTEGFSHTHNRKKYFLKVYFISVVMNGLLFLMLSGMIPVRPDGFIPMNGMMATFVILMAIYQGLDWLGEGKRIRGFAAVFLPLAWPVLAGLLMRGLPVLQLPLSVLGYTLLPMWNTNRDANLPTIISGLLLYLFRKNRKAQAEAFAGFTQLYFAGYVGIIAAKQPYFHWMQMFTVYYEWYGALAAALMLCYNGQGARGQKPFSMCSIPPTFRTCTDRRGTPDGRGIFPSIKAL